MSIEIQPAFVYDLDWREMLKNTFLHIPGLGVKLEKRIWDSGFLSWDDICGKDCTFFSPARQELMRGVLEDSARHLSAGNPRFFADRLPSRHFWRFFPEFRDSTAYLDIETTGLAWDHSVTTISVYDGRSVFTYVQGRNLDRFPEEILRYKVLVTYNGKCFDLPFLEGFFHVALDQVHIDLRYLLRGLGYTGGLKGCEKKAGIHRGYLDGVDGYFAVLLWEEYSRTGNEKALETLLAYNIEDVVNLETLMVMSYNLQLQNTPFEKTHRLPTTCPPILPYAADPEMIEKIRRERFAHI